MSVFVLSFEIAIVTVRPPALVSFTGNSTFGVKVPSKWSIASTYICAFIFHFELYSHIVFRVPEHDDVPAIAGRTT